jgi:hypothetical protein
MAANALYLVHDPAWLKALGDLATTGVGIAVLVRFWQVFPFDFGDASFDWALLARIMIVLGIIGSAIGLVVALVRLVRNLG